MMSWVERLTTFNFAVNMETGVIHILSVDINLCKGIRIALRDCDYIMFSITVKVSSNTHNSEVPKGRI